MVMLGIVLIVVALILIVLGVVNAAVSALIWVGVVLALVGAAVWFFSRRGPRSPV